MAANNNLELCEEDVGAEYLTDLGWHIRYRDWYCGHHDIDIVTIDDVI